MINRCTAPGTTGYERYKHVRIFKKWLPAFYTGGNRTQRDRQMLAFMCYVEHRGVRPAGCTSDRIDVYGHYFPTNLRWADKWVQANNKKFKAAFEAAKETAEAEGFKGTVVDAGITLRA
jgi:hypothetical protein